MAEGANFNPEAMGWLQKISQGQDKAAKQEDKAAEERKAEQVKVDEQIALDKRIEDLLKLGADRSKQKSQDDKIAQAKELEKLNKAEITNSDVADTVLADLKRGIIWSEEEIKFLVRETGESTNISGKELYSPLRLSLFGAFLGPDIPCLVDILGVDESVKRIKSHLQ